MPTPRATAAFQRAMRRRPQRMAIGPSMPVRAGNMPVLPAAAMYHYWYPERDGVEHCPKTFATQLRDVHPDLAICRPPGQAPTASHPWLVWYKKPAVTHWLSPGWLLLFCWQTKQLEPLPLDNRVFANLYAASAQVFGGAEKYFDSVVTRLKEDKARALQIDRDEMEAKKREYMESRKIKNIGRGSKFAMHHDGSIVPSKGEANWLMEREMDAMPGDVAKKVADARKKILSRRKERK